MEPEQQEKFFEFPVAFLKGGGREGNGIVGSRKGREPKPGARLP